MGTAVQNASAQKQRQIKQGDCSDQREHGGNRCAQGALDTVMIHGSSALQTPNTNRPDSLGTSCLSPSFDLGLRTDLRGAWIGNGRASPGDTAAASFRLHRLGGWQHALAIGQRLRLSRYSEARHGGDNTGGEKTPAQTTERND